MRVQDLMSHPAFTCHVNNDLSVAAKLMWDHDCGVIPVVRDDGKLAGVLTDRDICMAAFTQARRLDEILANSAMAQHPIAVHPGQRLEVAEELMAQHQVRRLPVVDENNQPVGIISLNDIAIESAQPDTRMKNGFFKVASALAQICRPRRERRRAA